VSAFPFERLARVSRRESEMLRAHARGGPLAALVRGAPAAGRWLGASTHVAVGWPVRAAAGSSLDRLAVLFENAAGARAALLLDMPIAGAIIERTIGGGGEALAGEGAPLRHVERGILAYAIARWIAPARTSFAVAAILTTGAALAEALGPRAYVRWPLTVHVGLTSGNAALLVPEDVVPIEAPRGLPSWAATLPIEVAVEAGSAVLSARTIASLERGDIVVPDGSQLRVAQGAIAGRVHVEVERARCAWIAEIAGRTLAIIGTEPRPPRGKGAQVVVVKDPNEVLERLGDTPVTLSVELARFTLPLAEIS
jgi:hypothetical protein